MLNETKEGVQNNPDSTLPAKARDYLANERTFLAYLRSALAFVGLGFVVARFSLFEREFDLVAAGGAPRTHTSVFLGVAMAIIGMGFAAFGARRYIEQDRALRQNRFASLSTGSAIGITVVVVIFGIIVAFNLVHLQPK